MKVKQSFAFLCILNTVVKIESHLGTVLVLSSVKELSHCGKAGLFEDTLNLKLVRDGFISQRGN